MSVDMNQHLKGHLGVHGVFGCSTASGHLKNSSAALLPARGSVQVMQPLSSLITDVKNYPEVFCEEVDQFHELTDGCMS